MNDTRIRAAVVLPYFGNGGAEHVVAELLAALDLRQVLPKVFCVYGEPMHNPLERMVLERGIEIQYIGKGKGFSAAAVKRLWAALHAFSPDVVHTHLYACMYALPWVMGHRIRMLHTFHSLPEVENRRLLRKLAMGVGIRCGKVIPAAVSASNQERICAYYHLPAERVPVVPNPVAAERFVCERKPAEQLRLVTVGRLSPEKNQALLLQALRRALDQYPQMTLTLAGGGPEEPSLRALCRDLGIEEQVTFLGHTDRVADVLASGDVFVLSSRYEGLPMAALEAMASGLPMIASDVGGMRDLVSDNGILTPPGDADALAEAMVTMGRHPELRAQMGARSAALAQQFDSKITAEKVLGLYQLLSRDSRLPGRKGSQ